MPESNASLSEIVRGHLDVDFIANADADEIFAHLARDMSEHFVTIGQSYTEHCPGEDLRH